VKPSEKGPSLEPRPFGEVEIGEKWSGKPEVH